MATKWPARQMYEVVFTEGLWWEEAGGGDIFPDSPYLQVSGTGDLAVATEYARAALKFSASVPAWATVGDITEANCVLWLYCDSNTTDSGIQGIEVATISAAWTMASTAAHMQGIATGAWSGTVPSYPVWTGQGWMAFPIPSSSAVLRGANGIMLRARFSLTESSSYRFMKDPIPVGRAFFAYDILDTIHGSATDRLAIDADAISALTTSQGVYPISGEIIESDIRPDESDVSITVGKGSSLALTDRSVQLPETWKLDQGNRGSLSLSRADVDLLDYRGSIIEISLKQKLGYLAESTVAIQKGIVGSVNKTMIEQIATIEDILFESLAMAPYYRNPTLGFESVNILSEPRVYALLLILINGGGIPWSRFRQGDLVWLLRRFGIVWDDITEADLSGFTNASFVEEYGVLYGLCISRGVDDSIIVWHPAVYRPSMKVHSINDTEINDNVYLKVNTVDTYDEVIVGAEEVMWDAALSRQIDGRDKSYTVTPLPAGIFVSADVAKYALGRQLAQRLVAGYEIYEFTAGARAIDWEVGDKLKITSTRNSLTAAVFTVVSVKGGLPQTNKHSVTAIRWPDSPGLQSTWEDTDLKGIYRLEEWDTAAATGVNQSPIGNAGDMTVTTINGLTHIDWRGPLANVVIRAPATFMPDGGGGSSTKWDLVDFVLGVYGRQSTEPYGGGGEDETYTRILMFHDLSGTKAVVCGIKRVPRDNGIGVDYYPTTDTRLFLGATDDYTADPIVWNHGGNDYVETPPGFATNAESWNYGMAVQWHSDLARLWVDQIYIGEITAFDADIDTCDFHTPIPDEHKVGCIRWLQNSTGWFDANRLVGRVGEDTYYP